MEKKYHYKDIDSLSFSLYYQATKHKKSWQELLRLSLS